MPHPISPARRLNNTDPFIVTEARAGNDLARGISFAAENDDNSLTATLEQDTDRSQQPRAPVLIKPQRLRPTRASTGARSEQHPADAITTTKTFHIVTDDQGLGRSRCRAVHRAGSSPKRPSCLSLTGYGESRLAYAAFGVITPAAKNNARTPMDFSQSPRSVARPGSRGWRRYQSGRGGERQ